MLCELMVTVWLVAACQLMYGRTALKRCHLGAKSTHDVAYKTESKMEDVEEDGLCWGKNKVRKEVERAVQYDVLVVTVNPDDIKVCNISA